MASGLSNALVQAWYRGSYFVYLLFPLAILYFLIIVLRRFLFRLGVLKRYRSSLPVVVVGNVTLGGTGKSPLVGYLVNELRSRGYQPGVISRGYGAQIASDESREVRVDSAADQVGDEPLMLKKRWGCPIVVSPNRKLSSQALERLGCDILISDDGMQHYALERDVEICVIDGQRKLGNGHVLPMGPLREPATRLRDIDFCVVNGAAIDIPYRKGVYSMSLQAEALKPLLGSSFEELSEGSKVHAVAGIGNPSRFFHTLEKMGMTLETHPFDDHHAFQQSDFDFEHELPIVMTEKDAVKCENLALKNAWFLPVSAQLDRPLVDDIIALLKTKGYLNG